jgi:hypothetical protein
MKPEQLSENPSGPVAVRQPQVRAGELVDSEAGLLVSASNRKPGHGEAASAHEIPRLQSEGGRIRATGKVGAGPAKFSLQLSYGGVIWQLR